MVYKIIRYFHINSKYKGYPLIVDAINFYIENYGNSIKITKDIYPLLSKKYSIPLSCVERNIRTVVETCWNNDKQAVEAILGYRTAKCPSNSEFIDAIAYQIAKDHDIFLISLGSETDKQIKDCES